MRAVSIVFTHHCHKLLSLISAAQLLYADWPNAIYLSNNCISMHSTNIQFHRSEDRVNHSDHHCCHGGPIEAQGMHWIEVHSSPSCLACRLKRCIYPWHTILYEKVSHMTADLHLLSCSTWFAELSASKSGEQQNWVMVSTVHLQKLGPHDHLHSPDWGSGFPILQVIARNIKKTCLRTPRSLLLSSADPNKLHRTTTFLLWLLLSPFLHVTCQKPFARGKLMSPCPMCTNNLSFYQS